LSLIVSSGYGDSAVNHTGKSEHLLADLCGGRTLLVPSCTAALELAFLMTLEPGDEVIMPSWAFPSCANAVILRGATPVFVDIDIDAEVHPELYRSAITRKTKAILVLHYGGRVTRRMGKIVEIARDHGIYVIEDAAQAIGPWKLNGDIGCLSFHYTKNIQCGQGGALVLRDEFVDRAERLVHCGTDKLRMYRGEQDGYKWLEVGSQQIMSEYQAEVLYEQLIRITEITEKRLKVWDIFKETAPMPRQPFSDNGHFFWFLKKDKWPYMRRMRDLQIRISSHFEALHNTPPGRKYGRTAGPCPNALRFESQLLKLDTSITEEEAKIAAEILWQPNTDNIPNIH